jgi:hypothetical protein
MHSYKPSPSYKGPGSDPGPNGFVYTDRCPRRAESTVRVNRNRNGVHAPSSRVVTVLLGLGSLEPKSLTAITRVVYRVAGFRYDIFV